MTYAFSLPANESGFAWCADGTEFSLVDRYGGVRNSFRRQLHAEITTVPEYAPGRMGDYSVTPPTIEKHPSVLLAEWQLRTEDAAALGLQLARDFCIYGAKVPVAMDNHEAWRSHYAVHEKRADGTVLQHHLAQRGGVMWTASHAANMTEPADMVEPSSIPCLTIKPRWKRDAASIPVRSDGGMYVFLKQFYIPREASIRALFHVGFSLYLFATPKGDDEMELALFEQDMDEQTAEDHYRLEEKIGIFLAAPHNLVAMEELIQTGDKYFHEFVLEYPDTTRPMLEMLLKHAKTKTLKSVVQKRLAGTP